MRKIHLKLSKNFPKIFVPKIVQNFIKKVNNFLSHFLTLMILSRMLLSTVWQFFARTSSAMFLGSNCLSFRLDLTNSSILSSSGFLSASLCVVATKQILFVLGIRIASQSVANWPKSQIDLENQKLQSPAEITI